MDLIKAKVYDEKSNLFIVELDKGGLLIPNAYFDCDYLDMFQVKHRVSDVWRYIVRIENNDIKVIELEKCPEIDSRFADRSAVETVGSNVILLILESPHKDEYSKNPHNKHELKPKAPAQGSTGTHIKKYLHVVLAKTDLVDGVYHLVIANPVQYMCSLGIFNHQIKARNKIRDDVWKAIWDIQDVNKRFVIRDEFLVRYGLYNPKVTINACTQLLRGCVTELLLQNSVTNLYETDHPSIRWNTLKDKIEVVKIA